MTAGPATRHLGLDLGATNLKWAVVDHADGTWTTIARDQVPTRLVTDPEAVPASVIVSDSEVEVQLHRRAHLPIVLASGLMNTPLPVPWWNGKPLRLTTYMG